jgi:hypothetical protein
MKPEANKPATIDGQIHLIRGASVMLDVDLANLYGVTPGALMQGVRRNLRRFRPDFVFQLTNQELTSLKSQSVISVGAAEGVIGTWPALRRAFCDPYSRDPLTPYGSAVYPAYGHIH